MFYDIFESPLGRLTVSTDGACITSLHIEGDRYFTEVPATWVRETSHPLLQQVKHELRDYFKTERHKFSVPLRPKGTLFQRHVWKAVQRIPSGSTASYKSIASNVHKPQGARAVGTAIGHNPICIIIPCHRVTTSNGSLGGFVAGITCKRQLLALETRSL